MSWKSAGLGVTVIGLGWAVGGFLPHPWLGLLLVAAGLVILFWPLLTRSLGIDPFRPARVRSMARLLRQAASEERKIQKKREVKEGAQSTDEAASWAWLYLRIVSFLDLGLAHHVRQDFDRYRKAEEQKLGNQFSPERATADYLERLADRLKKQRTST